MRRLNLIVNGSDHPFSSLQKKSREFFFPAAILGTDTPQHNPANMPNVNSKMTTEPDHINDEETAHTVNVIDRLNEENTATEQQRDAALAEVAGLNAEKYCFQPPKPSARRWARHPHPQRIAQPETPH